MKRIYFKLGVYFMRKWFKYYGFAPTLRSLKEPKFALFCNNQKVLKNMIYLVEPPKIKEIKKEERDRIIDKLWDYHGKPYETEAMLHIIKLIKNDEI